MNLQIQKKYLFRLISLVIIYVIFRIVKYYQNEVNYYSADIRKFKKSYNGIIQNKRMLEGEYNIPIFDIVSENGEKEDIIFVRGRGELFDMCENGDIFIKKANSIKCLLIKNTDTLEFNFIPPIPKEVLKENGLLEN